MSQDQPSYEFTAPKTVDGQERFVILSIEPSDERAVQYFKRVWGKMSSAVKGFHEHANDGCCPSWVDWQVYNWSKEAAPGRKSYVAWDGDLMVGFVNLRRPFESKITEGKEITYLEHIAAFPGCQATRVWNRLLGRIGQALMAFSIHRSVARGHDGIIGFHVSDGDAREWYDALNEKCEGKLLSPARAGVEGFHRGSSDLEYHETQPEGALMLLEQYRHG